MVGVEGLEPSRPISANGFLELNVSAALTLTTGYPASPLRLPIPPHPHISMGWLCRREETDYSQPVCQGLPPSPLRLPGVSPHGFYIKPNWR